MSSESVKVLVLTSPELLTMIASFDEGPLSLRRYREVSKGWLELTRSETLLKCLTSGEACLAYRVGGSYRLYSGAWDDRCLTSRRTVGSLQREVGRPVTVGRHRFFFEWLERDSESIAIWDLVDWWRVTVSRTEPCDNHVCRGGATCAVGDRIVLCGGSSSAGATLDSIYVLQTRQLNKGWQRSEKKLVHATSDACCELVRGEVVVVGGCRRDGSTGGWRAVSYAQFFDPETLEQLRVVSIPEEFHRCCATSCVSAKTGLVVVVGGGPSSRWEELQVQPVAPRSSLYSDRPHQEAAAYRQRLLHAVLSFDTNTLEWNSLNFPLVLRDLPSVVSLPDDSIVVAGAIAKPVDVVPVAGVYTDVDDYPPQPPVRFDPVDEKWRVLGTPSPKGRNNLDQQRPSLVATRRLGRLGMTVPRFSLQSSSKGTEGAPDLVVTDLALLDLDHVHQHLFQPKPKGNNLLPRDQLPPALLDEFANATPQSGNLWWYAERQAPPPTPGALVDDKKQQR